MKLKIIDGDYSVCKIENIEQVNFDEDFVFIGKTDEEISLVCNTLAVPKVTIERDDNWKALRVEGQLDFSLVGILAKISNILADNLISIFVVSTFNTDYILVKNVDFDKAILVLKEENYSIV